ncbi:hypothetical protein QBC46DRAFT_319192 [Diplogelasinospora grovesii]|uniref:Uncharacterized protein n=1 Tax=Diplogelasinospora grovesii TaxID=303347 RepID=A0AAN6N3E6_9PEZI|nr:hypothetical protein QBC46DRAFT_319192 [Diplogelasinospora grovesii]
MAPPPLMIPPCGENPRHPCHPPAIDKPLRISVMGSKKEVECLLPERPRLPTQPGQEYEETGVCFPRLVFATLYGRDVDDSVQGDFVLRGQFYGYGLKRGEIGPNKIVSPTMASPDDTDPEVLQLNIFTASMSWWSKLPNLEQRLQDLSVLVLVPRCCQTREGTTDRMRVMRVNDDVKDRGSHIAAAHRQHSLTVAPGPLDRNTIHLSPDRRSCWTWGPQQTTISATESRDNCWLALRFTR